MSFGFRRRAKSKEGLEGMLQMPTGGDLCAMADTLVTRVSSNLLCTTELPRVHAGP